jgi:hypothetical protein
MLWLFHRNGEYLYCEARTCLDDSGFELVIESGRRVQCEWFADETQLTRRWDRLNRELRLEGWADYTGSNVDVCLSKITRTRKRSTT